MTFNVDDWITHTPKSILAKNFGIPASLFDTVPTPNPYITTTNSSTNLSSQTSTLTGPSSYIFHNAQRGEIPIPGGGGTLSIIDSRNFPISTTIAATIVTLTPGSLRELHWHPNAEEWLYFHSGTGRATVFIGSGNARTFDFSAGDTAVFPDNSGHYIENTSQTDDLVWIEIYKSDRVADVSLGQWLALTPREVVAGVLKVSLETVDRLKKEKQVLVKG